MGDECWIVAGTWGEAVALLGLLVLLLLPAWWEEEGTEAAAGALGAGLWWAAEGGWVEAMVDALL